MHFIRNLFIWINSISVIYKKNYLKKKSNSHHINRDIGPTGSNADNTTYYRLRLNTNDDIKGDITKCDSLTLATIF